MKIRMANAADSKALLAIYEQYIDTAITFECELPSVDAFAERITTTLTVYPYLVVERDGVPIGYAYAHRLRERAAYGWDAELSIYLDRSETSHGVGTILYQTLISILALQGVKTVCGGVTMPNPKSEGLHLGLGFSKLGAYHNTGYKNRAWHDVAWFEKAIGEYEEEPLLVMVIGDVSKDKLREVLENANNELTLTEGQGL